MSTRSAIQKSFDCLCAIYVDGAFGNITLNNLLNKTQQEDKALVTKIVYGVLDCDLWLDFCLKGFITKVEPTVLVLLKIGAFCITKLNLPSAVAVNDCVELLKKQGKPWLCKFVNAVLRNVSRTYEKDGFLLPQDKLSACSVKYSFPLWALQKLNASFGEQAAIDFASFQNSNPTTTVRVNTEYTSMEELKAFCDKNSLKWQETSLPDALNVFGDVTLLTEKKVCTPMSLSAMYAAREIAPQEGENILDCCAAPGGKSVYIANMCPTAKVTSCDIYEHKLKLINGYAKKMRAQNVKTVLNDATVVNDDFVDKFDKILLDAPCSGFGVLQSRPDVKVFRKPKDVATLALMQSKMLDVAKNYLKTGGKMVYSTCTVFEEENSKNVTEFLNRNPNFELCNISNGRQSAFADKIGFQFLPNVHGIDGFYIAVLKRNK